MTAHRRPILRPRAAHETTTRLAIVGDIAHTRDEAGRLCTIGPLAAQLDRWASMFDAVTVTGPMLPWPQPTFSPYEQPNIAHVELRFAGGPRLRDKLRVPLATLQWLPALWRVMRASDAVHLRCPCNVTLIAIPLARLIAPRRYAIFAGAWRSYEGEPWSYRLQRWLLRRRAFGGPVHMYGEATPGLLHLEPFFSPAYSMTEWEQEGAGVARRLDDLRRIEGNVRPLRLVTVGRLSANKNHGLILRAVAELTRLGTAVELEVVGDGPLRETLVRQAEALGIAHVVSFRGQLSREEVWRCYRRAHVNVLATRAEGFGKVLLEGMVVGAVPICSDSAVARDIVGDGTRGLTFPADSCPELVGAISTLARAPATMVSMIENSRVYTHEHTLEAFERDVRALLTANWVLPLRESAGDAR